MELIYVRVHALLRERCVLSNIPLSLGKEALLSHYGAAAIRHCAPNQLCGVFATQVAVRTASARIHCPHWRDVQRWLPCPGWCGRWDLSDILRGLVGLVADRIFLLVIWRR